eukprot:5732887-Amphidinium_carterae.1
MSGQSEEELPVNPEESPLYPGRERSMMRKGVAPQRRQYVADNQRASTLRAEHELGAQRLALSSAQAEMVKTAEVTHKLEVESAMQREQVGVVRAEAAAQVVSTRQQGVRSEQTRQHEASKLRGELLSTR